MSTILATFTIIGLMLALLVAGGFWLPIAVVSVGTGIGITRGIRASH